MNPNYNEFKFPSITQKPWNKVFRAKTPPDAIDFISKTLIYDPKLRLNPLTSLLHPFFVELREQNTKLPNGENLPPLFNFTKEELSKIPEEYKSKLIPKWYKETKPGK